MVVQLFTFHFAIFITHKNNLTKPLSAVKSKVTNRISLIGATIIDENDTILPIVTDKKPN